ncbi:MAG: selenocysteine-specific translation elongation factor [Gemmatimonadota bacterium]|nr:MAG: selenocysteine-specific translation elongation factor [Gemmatimonadota bacterium]
MSDDALILGTAGHIDHGKTALVKALTSIDTDRLKEEKARGITIDLGFAEFTPASGVNLGVVDVPGHEGFIRNMLAGATGMDVVLLVIASDEGVMPQTREHLAIVQLLGVTHMVVALTKSDLVDEGWLELATAEVTELLADTPYSDAAVIATSATTGAGLPELTAALVEAARSARDRRSDDLVRLPIDRVFTVRGTGTVVTGTLWSGSLKEGSSVRLLPGGERARVRGIQVHGRSTSVAHAGARTAVALVGPTINREHVNRGQVLVSDDAWAASSMLTAWLTVLPATGWSVEQGQRVRVHLGTAEVMARTVVLDSDGLGPGEEGWVQLRLEQPILARARDRFVIRSYSPMTTIGGGLVAEPNAPKRRTGTPEALETLKRVIEGDAAEAVEACAALSKWSGALVTHLPIMTGLSASVASDVIPVLMEAGACVVAGRVYHRETVESGRKLFLDSVAGFHAEAPLRPGIPLEELRQRIPNDEESRLADGLLSILESEGKLRMSSGIASIPGFQPELNPGQRKVYDTILRIYHDRGLTPPAVGELPGSLRKHRDLWPILKLLEVRSEIVALDGDFFMATSTLQAAESRVISELGGRHGLGPSDFKEVLPVSRKHLIPILAYFDRKGVTSRRDDGRDVAEGEGNLLGQ